MCGRLNQRFKETERRVLAKKEKKNSRHSHRSATTNEHFKVIVHDAFSSSFPPQTGR